MNRVIIQGWIHRADHTVKSMHILWSDGRSSQIERINQPCPDLGLSADCRFEFTGTLDPLPPMEDYKLIVLWDDLECTIIKYLDIISYWDVTSPRRKMLQRFLDEIKSPSYESILEIGSRARSGNTHKHLFEGKKYIGFDILKGVNVDIVGDAHRLSDHFAPGSIDAIFSMSTFEHLVMPWKVVLEMNRVLRGRGLVLLSTHQTLGLHDMPWDFWRFSDTAWRALFNQYTGFEILDAALEDGMYLVPFRYLSLWKDFEKSAGWSSSWVLARKTGDTKLQWQVPASDIVCGMYPG
ncbi:MAG: class I SAM-dependent methyltransferase [Fimbriimonadaceae bacterium]